MGFIEKQISKSQTKPETLSVPGASPYADMDNVRLLLYAAAVELAGAGTFSSAERGRTSILNGLFAPGSTVWYEAHPPGVLLGTQDARGARGVDWHIRLEASEAADGSTLISIETPSFLTKDGSLVNASAYKKTRARIREGLSSGRLPDGRRDQDAFAAGVAGEDLIAVDLPELPSAEWQVALVTSASVELLDEKFSTWFIREDRSTTRHVDVALGTAGRSTLTLDVLMVADATRIGLSLQIDRSQPRAETALAMNQARSIARRVRTAASGDEHNVDVEGNWSWVD
jgi:hypothetical protein